MAHRFFRDSTGRKWEVWNVAPSKVERRRRQNAHWDGTRDRRRRQEFRATLGDQWSGGWLVFETRGEKRRLAPIPQDWEASSSEELEEMLQKALLVPASRRLVE